MRGIVLKNTILEKGRCFYHHLAERLATAALAAGGANMVNRGFRIAFQQDLFLLRKFVVQTKKMTCLLVRFHSYSFILCRFQGQARRLSDEI